MAGMRICLLFLMVSAFSTAACAAAPPTELKSGDQLIGSWSITLTPSGSDAGLPGAKAFDEKLTFDGTNLSAKTLADHGFGPAAYQEDSRAFGPATFDCTQNSEKEGTIVWNGLTTGQDLHGTLIWTKKDGTVIHYDFQGGQAG